MKDVIKRKLKCVLCVVCALTSLIKNYLAPGWSFPPQIKPCAM